MSALRPPVASQGPGPLPHGLIAGLDLVIARRAAGALPGDRRAAGLGAGTELAQLRPYEVGDDVRQIDAAATARTGVPHVRLHVPERTLTTWIVVDASPSMAFGTADRLKWDVAEGAASHRQGRDASRARRADLGLPRPGRLDAAVGRTARTALGDGDRGRRSARGVDPRGRAVVVGGSGV